MDIMTQQVISTKSETKSIICLRSAKNIETLFKIHTKFDSALQMVYFTYGLSAIEFESEYVLYITRFKKWGSCKTVISYYI